MEQNNMKKRISKRNQDNIETVVDQVSARMKMQEMTITISIIPFGDTQCWLGFMIWCILCFSAVACACSYYLFIPATLVEAPLAMGGVFLTFSPTLWQSDLLLYRCGIARTYIMYITSIYFAVHQSILLSIWMHLMFCILLRLFLTPSSLRLLDLVLHFSISLSSFFFF